MILEVLEPSRKRVKAGDIFAIKPIEHEYHFGRVVETSAKIHQDWSESILLYIFRAHSPTKTEIPILELGDFLINPVVINRLPWSRGYFQTVGHETLTERNRYPIHCFRGMGSPTGLVDEFARPILDTTLKPLGLLALSSFRTVDIEVGDALGYDPERCG